MCEGLKTAAKVKSFVSARGSKAKYGPKVKKALSTGMVMRRCLQIRNQPNYLCPINAPPSVDFYTERAERTGSAMPWQPTERRGAKACQPSWNYKNRQPCPTAHPFFFQTGPTRSPDLPFSSSLFRLHRQRFVVR